METFLIVLAFLLLFQSALALIAGLRFGRYALRATSSRLDRYCPKAAVIVPCKGLEADFEENICALFAQDYRDYELIFVTESEADPAYPVLDRLIKQSQRSAWLVVAGEAEACGQKVHNLCAALETLNAVDRRAEVLVFADSDARPTPDWLGELVAPLGHQKIGATTGFRWYLPVRGGFWSFLLSTWNASALSMLGEKSRFAWGGATAIRRENFEKLGVKRQWDGALSDDYVLTRAVKAAGQQIKFIPSCLMATHADASLGELLEFTTRQITITRVYAPRLWSIVFASHLLFSFTFWSGLIWLTVQGPSGGSNEKLAWLLTGIFALGAITGCLRGIIAAQLLAADRRGVQKCRWAYLLLGPASSLLYLYNALVSLWTKRIVWRGISYEMISPRETAILYRPTPPNSPDSAAGLPRPRRASARSSSSS